MPQNIDQNAYEILQARLQKQAKDLQGRLEKLNAERQHIFGGVKTTLTASERVTTENYCLACDMLALGNTILLGYNVQLGLRTGIQLSDVFAAFEESGNRFKSKDLESLGDEKFRTDFNNLYRYYKKATFSKFLRKDHFVYFVFQVTEKEGDIKAFKWIEKDGVLTYVDARSENEIKYPNQHAFLWEDAKQDMQRSGMHPHVSIEDKIFVETVGGDLTIKIEDNTKTGRGIYAEPVEYPEQTLNDAVFNYAMIGGLIALRIVPYREDPRFLMFNEKTKEVYNIPELEDSAILLPDSQGVLFANGYFLRTGGFKTFQGNHFKDKKYLQTIVSPNGEDFLYVFYGEKDGSYILLQYNMMLQEVATPIVCNGFSLFDSGKLCYFKAEREPTKFHTIQVWETPFSKVEKPNTGFEDHFLFKIGNKTVVRAMAQGYELLELCAKKDSYEGLYDELALRSLDALDTFHWISDENAFKLSEPIQDLHQTANQAIQEYEKKRAIEKQELEAFDKVQAAVNQLEKEHTFLSKDVQELVSLLTEARKVNGEVLALFDCKYLDEAAIKALESRCETTIKSLSEKSIDSLIEPTSLDSYKAEIEVFASKIDDFKTAKEGSELEEGFQKIGADLQLLIEVVGNLKIEDPTKTTQIIESISTVFAQLNQLSSRVRGRKKDLVSTEATVELAAQLKLVDQTFINLVELSDTPEKCNLSLSKVLVQLEELESKFAEFDDFIGQIQTKREQVYSVFEERRQYLIEKINNRTIALANAADRILKGISNRVNSFKEVTEINTFFASDLMVDKVRDIIKNLEKLGDSGKSHEIQSKLKASKESSLKRLLDQKELFVEGDNIIKLGQFSFSTNTNSFALVIVTKNNQFCYHLVGTSYYEPIGDLELLRSFEPVFKQTVETENEAVYRASYLAYTLFKAFPLEDSKEAKIQDAFRNYLSGGFVKGIHDADALKIWNSLEELHQGLGIFRFSPQVRTAALFMREAMPEAEKALFNEQVLNLRAIQQSFGTLDEEDRLYKKVIEQIKAYTKGFPLVEALDYSAIQSYLIQLGAAKPLISKHAADLCEAFQKALKKKNQWVFLEEVLSKSSLENRLDTALDWLEAFCEKENHSILFVVEAALLLSQPKAYEVSKEAIPFELEVTGLHGEHPTLNKGAMQLHYYNFRAVLEQFEATTIPMYKAFQEFKARQLQAFKAKIRLEQFEPKPMASFIRNTLINEVYLPLIGSNMAKQIGVAGQDTRTDRMGMLLLISPPGYGKTTLMEYVAQRMGMIFMKINGPSIGHQVTSLDPSSADNLATKSELDKLNLAFEMGDNVMLYLDDIQHCNPEFLQKFISLCDGQRKIEGVWKGMPKTYDLREKRFFVVMAGNPYTESGDSFKIPDMLANRADIYNLGNIIGGKQAAFERSYLENALTSNAYLAPLLSRGMGDIKLFLDAVGTGKNPTNLEGNYTAIEQTEILKVLEKLVQVRAVILKVNQAYIAAAGMADAYRVEPAFKLQGSYRDMNKLAAKVVPLMNDAELNLLIMNHYESEAQTLTSGAEANLLKFKQMMGWATPADDTRWEEILKTFQKGKYLVGGDDNPMSKVILQMQQFNDSMADLKGLFENWKQ